MEDQRPLSRAYLSICPFNKGENQNAEEQKQSQQAYQKDKAQQKTKDKLVREKIRRSLIDSGFPTAKVDEVFKDTIEIPPKLVDSYLKMVRENIKERLENDDDY